MPLFNIYPEDEIEAIQKGESHPNWTKFQTPKYYVALIWGVLFLPMIFILQTELWFTIRIFVAGFGLQLFHSLYYKKSLEKNIITTGFFMERIPEKWSYVKPFYARDMLKWIYSMYGQGFHKLMRFAVKLSFVFFLIGLFFGLLSLILPINVIEISLPDFVFTIPERWRYFFSALNVFSSDGASLETVLSRRYILYDFRSALLSKVQAWYIILLFAPLLIFYLIQMMFLGIRIYMLGSFLHHFGYWHHERKPDDRKHPISNLLALLIFTSFLYATLFMRMWAPLSSVLVFMTFSPQSQRYNYFKQMSKTGRFLSIIGFLILIASFFWTYLPVPMPEEDRIIEIYLNMILIPIMLIYLLIILKGTPKNPNIEFEGISKVEKLRDSFSLLTKLILMLFLIIMILAVIIAIMNFTPTSLLYPLAIGLNFLLFYVGWVLWGIIIKKSIPLVHSILPLLDDDKAHESDNHFWEGFASGFFWINTIMMASLVFRRYSVYVSGFEYLEIMRFQGIFEFTIATSLFMAYLIIWIYYWTGTKGIHSVWHGLTVLLQKIEISGSIPNLTLPPIEKFYEIGEIYKKSMKICISLFAIYYILAGLYLRTFIVIVLFGIFGLVFVKMYVKDIRTDYPLIFSENEKRAQ